MLSLVLTLLFFNQHTTNTYGQINTEMMLRVGRNALYFSDYALSIQYFTLAANAKPYLADPWFYRGVAKFYLEDYYGAENDLTKAISINPYNFDSYQIRSICRIQRGNYIAALEDLATSRKEDPLNKGLQHNAIYCYLQMDSLDLATAEADSMLTRWPEYIDATKMKATILLKQEKYADAMPYINKIIDKEPKDVNAYINRAACNYYLENLKGQMDDYDIILSLDSTNFFAHYNRGQLRAYVGEDNKAIEDFDFVIERDPEDIMAIYNRALLRSKTGDYKGAIEDLTHVINEFPKFTQGYALRAEARRKIGDRRGANKDEAHVLAEQAAHVYGYSTATSRLANKSMRKRSEIDFEKSDQLVTADSISNEEQVQQYKDDYRGKIQNRHVEAKLLAQLKVEDNDYRTQAIVIYNRAYLEAQQGALTEAIMDLDSAIELCPDFGEAYFNRGLLYIFSDEIQKGVADLSMAGQFGIYSSYSIIKQYQNKITNKEK